MPTDTWGVLDADVADLMVADGRPLEITIAGQVTRISVLWEPHSFEQGQRLGPRFWCATSDLPSGFTQSVQVEVDGTTYTVSYREPDGHGVERVTLTEN